jgi:hypothetical protein
MITRSESAHDAGQKSASRRSPFDFLQAASWIASGLPTNRELAKDESPFFRATIASCQTAEPNQSSTGHTR